MPFEMKRIAFTEIVPAACKDAQTISDDRSEDYARHAHVFCQEYREQYVPAYLEYIADIIAELVPVTIYHLFKIKDQNGEKCIYRTESVILKCVIQDIALDIVYSKIRITYEEYGERGDQAY